MHEVATPNPRTMTVTEAAAMLGISRTTAYECVRTGDLPALRLGGRIVVPTQAIDNLLERASTIPNP
ncbi:helix-turn-helix domain-containing protein [Ilumatobacter sp.]|uniref:helix-turn-helix domain-containing protein n=1 Tax=Ilumatobacter sp. TaxID=1967498 RepID=UPI003751F838